VKKLVDTFMHSNICRNHRCNCPIKAKKADLSNQLLNQFKQVL